MNKLLRCLAHPFQFAIQIPSKPSSIVLETASGKDKYRSFHKTGPELFITRTLMVNGPLTSKEIWRIYEKKLHESKKRGIEPEFQYWPSLSKLKETLKFMRFNEKIKSAGYDRKIHSFHGWQIQEKRALKFVHPIVINEIQKEITQRQTL